jgi:hypothetical protein
VGVNVAGAGTVSAPIVWVTMLFTSVVGGAAGDGTEHASAAASKARSVMNIL